MSLIRDLQIRLSLDTAEFSASARAATGDLSALTSGYRALKTASAVPLPRVPPPPATGGGSAEGPTAAVAAPPSSIGSSTVQGDGGQAASATAALEQFQSTALLIASRVGTSIQAGLAPLSSMAAQFSSQFEHVGGTIVEISHRASRFFTESFHQMQISIRALAGEPILKQEALDSEWRYIKNIARSLHDVEQPLDRINRTTLGGAVDGARKLDRTLGSAAASGGMVARSLGPIVPAAAAAGVSVRRLGAEIAVALGFVGLIYKGTQAVANFFRVGIGGARDLAETQNKVQRIFGDAADLVTANGDRMVAAYRLPRGEILDAASNIGLLAKGTGQTAAASAQLSSVMVEAAANASSFYNVPFADALEKIRSGLTGESRPLKDFGIQMDEAAVKAEGLRLGMIKGKQELDEAGKIAARSSLIIKGLATANGDLEATQDGVANQLRTLQGNAINAATSFGTILLPVVQRGLAVMIEFSAGTIGAFERIKEGIQPFVDAFVAGIDTVGLVLRNLPLFGQVAWLKIQEGVYNTIAVIETFPENLSRIAEYISGNWKEIIVDSVNSVWTAFQNLGSNIGELWAAVMQVFQGGEFKPNFKPLLDGFKATVAELPALAKPEFVSMAKDIQGVIDQIGRNEAARVQAKVPNPKPELPKLAGGAATKPGDDKKNKYQGTAAAELGSTEAASSLARFFNGANGTDAKETAKSTRETARHTKSAAMALKQIALRAAAQAEGLGGFPI